MELHPIDWLIIAFFLLVSLLIAFAFRKQAANGLSAFFLGNRSLPWYMAGISMVATTFAADTPLAVTEIVAEKGIAGNWLWWNFLAGGMFTTFFFARYWRRSGLHTEVELISLRYSGKAAGLLRAFKSVYLGLFMNVLVMAWVNLAMLSLINTFCPPILLSSFPAGAYGILASLMAFIALLSALSGLKGIAFMDAFQFILAMGSCILLAYLVVDSPQIGSMQALKDKSPGFALNFFPVFNSASEGFALGIGSFIAYTGIMWWSSWYPGQEPGGGGYVAQRMMSTKSEKDSLLATLFFQIAHYVLRPWPWIIVALAALVLYPDLPAADKKLGYAFAMRDFLPIGLKGLMLAAFLGAYMSTISTQLNWGASFLINDFWLPLKSKEISDAQIVRASRGTTILLMAFSLAITTQINSIKTVWEFILECGAGLGAVLILRWFWWRINVWSEISATLTPFIFYALCKWVWHITFPNSFFLTVGGTTIVWLLVTMFTKPESEQTLINFGQRVRPSGWWKHYSDQKENLWWRFLAWISACIMAYAALFALGYFLFKDWSAFGFALISCLLGLLILRWSMRKGQLLQT